MAKQLEPVFTKDAVLGIVQVASANTNRDGTTGTYTLLYTAGADGAIANYVRMKAIVTTTAGNIRIFLKNNGGTLRQVASIPVQAIVVTASQDGAEGEFFFSKPLGMNSGDEIRVTNEKSEAINVFLMGTAF